MLGKVMVCDDQEIVCEVLGSYLKRKGYEVTRAKDGAECIALLKTMDVDVLFLDVNMPRLGGLAVMQELKKHNIKTQVILMSGFDQPQSRDAGKHDERAFIAKPFSLENVMTVLSACLKSKLYRRILVVDDQDMLREMLRDFLSGEGYEITEARNGKECIERAKENDFDAIFMDVRMPEMDGLEALKSLRDHGVESPVFLMSGFGDVTCLEDALGRGAQNFLPKPFTLEKALNLLQP